MRTGVDEDHALHQIIDQLRTYYVAVHDGDHVAETVRSIYATFDDQPVRDFVPLLVERQARETLDAESPSVAPAQRSTSD